MYRDRKVYAVIVASGHSNRMGFDKMLRDLGGMPLIRKTALAFESNGYIDEIIVTASENIDSIKDALRGLEKVKKIVIGGSTRPISVMKGVGEIRSEGLVAIHDGARPFVSDEVICNAVRKARETGSAVPCVPVKDTIKVVGKGAIENTPDRSTLFIAQTPQVFDIFLYKQTAENYFDPDYTDDASMFERAGIKPSITEGEYSNYKVTVPEDLKMGQKLRIGHGYDVHRFREGRDLVLCGVRIPFEKGLLGHSDADVALHAAMDAVLGARALGDIGKLFPDTDPAYKGADSTKLAAKVTALAVENGYRVENIDITVICQRPKLSGFVDEMRKTAAKCFDCPVQCVSVKATTEEGLGFTGAGQGIACHRVCLLSKNS